ncbi:MAG: hypothetical protein M1813_002029 [Trichoglossum hirsutum]|nr:MAG: hypothetical protein M1813_002029 [Trichoglossum hirsutum]
MAGNLESSRAFCQLIRVNHKAIVLADGASSLTTKDSDSISGNHISLEGKEAMVLHALVRVGIRLAATNLRIKLLQFSWTGLRKSATDDIFESKNGLMIEVDDIFAEADAESKVGGAEIQDSDAEFGTDDIESEIKDIETICYPLKRKAKTGSQGSKDNPLVIPDSDTESESDSEIYSWRRMIDETDDEANETEFEIGGTRVRACDAQSKNDGEDNGQSHPHLAASSTHHSDFDSTLFKSADRIESQSVARVGENGEWGIHEIISKEVIEGKVYYCVDWEPMMMPLDELWGAERLVREFEAKEQVQQRKIGRIQKKKHRG